MDKKVIAFHLRFGNRQLIPELKTFIRDVLKPANVTMIILEIDKSFVFKKHPEIKGGEHALTHDDVEGLVAFSKKHQIDIVPLMQCLGHQGWGGSRSALLEAYPEFDETLETPLDAEWPEIFCRSWCPLHPDVNVIVFDMIDELMDAFGTPYFHIGMDEVYEIASEQCPRCRGKERSELFAKSINDLHKHIVDTKGGRLMMWGDRLIDAEKFGYDNWEGDTFGTFKAIDSVAKDIIILDWHYDEREKGYPTPYYFMEHGFSVMPACWYKENVAQQLFTETQAAANTLNAHAQHFGNLVTSWHHWDKEAFERFIQFTKTPVEQFADSQDEQARLYYTLNMTGKLIN